MVARRTGGLHPRALPDSSGRRGGDCPTPGLGESFPELAWRLPRIVPLDYINLGLGDPARDVTLATAGFEHNPALIGLLAPILIAGPGRFGLGRFLPLPRSAPTGRPIIVLE